MLVARGAEQLEQLGVLLRGEHGISVDTLAADLATDEGCSAVSGRVGAVDEPIDLLINNAGIGTSGRFGDIDLQRERGLIDLNVTAVVRLSHAAVQGMKLRGRGGILNVSSLSGLQPYPNGAVYGASKAFVNSFTKALHTELAGSGVQVLVLCPGFTRTNFQHAAGISRTPIPDWMWLQPDAVAAEGLAALRGGRAMRVSGLLYRAWAGVTKVLPDALVRRALFSAGSHRS